MSRRSPSRTIVAFLLFVLFPEVLSDAKLFPKRGSYGGSWHFQVSKERLLQSSTQQVSGMFSALIQWFWKTVSICFNQMFASIEHRFANKVRGFCRQHGFTSNDPAECVEVAAVIGGMLPRVARSLDFKELVCTRCTRLYLCGSGAL